MEFGFHFPDFGPDFEESQLYGIELGGGEFGAREGLIPERIEDDIGRAVEHETEEVRQEKLWQDVRPLLSAVL